MSEMSASTNVEAGDQAGARSAANDNTPQAANDNAAQDSNDLAAQAEAARDASTEAIGNLAGLPQPRLMAPESIRRKGRSHRSNCGS
jgi:hypothetical protein